MNAWDSRDNLIFLLNLLGHLESLGISSESWRIQWITEIYSIYYNKPQFKFEPHQFGNWSHELGLALIELSRLGFIEIGDDWHGLTSIGRQYLNKHRMVLNEDMIKYLGSLAKHELMILDEAMRNIAHNQKDGIDTNIKLTFTGIPTEIPDLGERKAIVYKFLNKFPYRLEEGWWGE